MRSELRERWVRALNSGAYLQGRLRLRSARGDRYAHCCLGVLQDIAAPDAWASTAPEANWMTLDQANRLGLRTVQGRFELDWMLGQEDIWLGVVDAIVRSQRLKGVATVEAVVGRIQEDAHPAHAGRRMTSLSQLNDRGVPFEVIAQIILGSPPGLFETSDVRAAPVKGVTIRDLLSTDKWQSTLSQLGVPPKQAMH
jgi:hypothetical protein